MKKVLTILNELKNENLDSERLLDDIIINQNQPVKGISKLELMGGGISNEKRFF
ncbi:MAG: hypothetical protein VSS75_010915 [Candidatus Parabeggiatoa sp.]